MIKLTPKKFDWHIPEGLVCEKIVFCSKCNSAYSIEPEDIGPFKCDCEKKPEIKYTKRDIEFWKTGKAIYELAKKIAEIQNKNK